MSKTLIRNYQVNMVIPKISNSESLCNDFKQFIIKEAKRLKSFQMDQGETANSNVFCNIQIQIQCYSCGKNSINSFSKYIKSAFPQINFITGDSSVKRI